MKGLILAFFITFGLLAGIPIDFDSSHSNMYTAKANQHGTDA
ncbi:MULTISPECIES: hypothetical protein [Brevibacillus]|nr:MULTISPECIES: hypothetical protein [Bacillales]